MKVIILAGGMGSRLGEETATIPKPMVEIGGYPILWHIMKIYSFYGFNEFIILTGYKGHVIKEFFLTYYDRYSDMTIDLANNDVQVHNVRSEPWTVTVLYTGQKTLTAGRIKEAKAFVKDEPFMLTYGDTVADINIAKLVKSHEQSGKIVTLTAVQPAGRFGSIDVFHDDMVGRFQEKPLESGNWINGGFFVCQPEAFNYIPENAYSVMWEDYPLQELAKRGQLHAYKHNGFWHPMDMLKDKNDLVKMWTSNQAPWALWKAPPIPLQ